MTVKKKKTRPLDGQLKRNPGYGLGAGKQTERSYLDLVQHHQRPIDAAHGPVGWGGEEWVRVYL